MTPRPVAKVHATSHQSSSPVSSDSVDEEGESTVESLEYVKEDFVAKGLDLAALQQETFWNDIPSQITRLARSLTTQRTDSSSHTERSPSPEEKEISIPNREAQHVSSVDDAESIPDRDQDLPLARDNLFSLLRPEFHSSITISDDQSVSEKVEQRHLFALRDRVEEGILLGDQVHGGNHALQDYQMQLMLLEQQNKKRLLIAGLEQDQSVGPIITDIHTADEAREMTDMGELKPEEDLQEDFTPPANASSVPYVKHIKRDASVLELLSLADKDVSQMSTQDLQDCLRDLQRRSKHLKTVQDRALKPTVRYQVLYRVLQWNEPKKSAKSSSSLSGPFFDPPEQFHGQGDTQTLRCKVPVQNIDLFLEKNKDVSFIVYHTYVTGHPDHDSSGNTSSSRGRRRNIFRHVEESIQPISRGLIQGLETILTSHDGYADMLQVYRATSELHAPYLFMYHHRKNLDLFKSTLDSEARNQLAFFSTYVLQRHGAAYATADSMISQGRISSDYTNYLFKPGDVLVVRTEHDYRGWVAASWAKKVSTKKVDRTVGEPSENPISVSLSDSLDPMKRRANETVLVHTFSIEAWAWEFDGNFQRKGDLLQFTIQSEDKPSSLEQRTYLETHDTDGESQAKQIEVPIKELAVFPIDFASNDLVQRLRARGKIFWKCRTQRFVSYRNDRDNIQGVENDRYMIDLKTYARLHPYASERRLKDHLGPDIFAQDDPPASPFGLLLPLKIKGYNVRLKKWHDLKADQISDVQWNKEAFQKVVIERKAKDLIRALVSNQLAVEVSTDLIEGKGNGLILLLHGSPGTGKTMTAESVAEIAEKPLYRVTCGDVGTNAEHVEKYLESVFHLGKLWGCVVLLDEADVFLEQRSLEDLQRNALVSVFLRMLEYYEGILILTSNRVGIFDEAFKSRIQLALHFPTLGPYQRIQIWENFIDRLATFDDESVDIADLRDNLEKLGEEKMNGRQIRNVITTARQYAVWKKVTLTYEHLRDVIDVSGRFDKYLSRLNGGLTQDQLAEDEGIRLA